MGLRPLVKEKQIFSFRYMFSTISAQFPLDLDAFDASSTRFVAVATDLDSGDPAYLERGVCSDMMLALQASGSMPMLSTPVSLDGRRYLDGGPSMPVAYQKAMEDGYEKIVLVLTRHKGYRKKPLSRLTQVAARRSFQNQKQFLQTMEHSPLHYNTMMDEIDRLEADGRLFVLRPSQPVTVSRTEKNVKKLEDLFLLGREDAKANLAALQTYLSH